MKYNVGDKVKVREDLKYENIYGEMEFTGDMVRYLGKIVTIESFYGYYPGYYIKELPDYIWTDEMFEELNNFRKSLDDIPDDIRELIEMGIYTEKEALAKCRVICTKETIKHTENKTEVKFMKNFKIVNYKVCDNNGVKTVVVKFKDGASEHAVCCPEDNFELERGIEVCVLKHIFGRDGYKTMLKSAMKQIKTIDKEKEDKKKAEAEEKAKKARIEKHKAKRREKKRQARISEMVEAYVNAIMICNELCLEEHECNCECDGDCSCGYECCEEPCPVLDEELTEDGEKISVVLD